MKDTERQEREILVLRLENELLNFERRLPPGHTGADKMIE
jgi:hypothetical protein